MRLLLAIVISCILLTGCDNSTQSTETASASETVRAPILDEALILSSSGLKPVKKYTLDDGHGFYMQQSPDAAIEFRDTPSRINVALRTFPEAGYEAKNATANEIVKKLVSVITGTDGQLVDDAIAGKAKLGKQFINGLPVNIAGREHDWLITISKQ